ncbi:hypothetical protein N8979_01555 [bacterium]|nr:hypothetical protein [bacterium]
MDMRVARKFMDMRVARKFMALTIWPDTCLDRSLNVMAFLDGSPRMKHISLITFEVRDPTDAQDSANTTPIGLGNRNASIETQQLPPQVPFDMSDSLPNDAAEPIDSLTPEMI